MKNTFVKAMWLISGILLVFAGIVTMVNPSSSVEAIAFVLGLAMLISGAFNVIIYVTTKHVVFGAGWVLVDGVLECILAIFLFCNHYLAAMAIPMVFGMWVIFSGISRLITSFDLKKLGLANWWWLAIIAAVELGFGFISFLNPVVASIAMGIILGLFFIIQGVASICLWFYTQKIDF